MLIPYATDSVPDVLVARLARRRPDLGNPASLVPLGWDALTGTIKRFVDVGTTKFVVAPLVEPAGSWDDHLSAMAEALLPLET